MNGRKSLMIVEDSPTQSARLRKFFEQDNLEVLEVNSAEKALEYLEVNRPDLIVLDYNLPGMSGNDFCREIRMNVNTRSIPVLMLTAEADDVAQMKGLESGVDDYVVKSADPDILRVRVRALLRKTGIFSTAPEADSRFTRVRILAIDDSATYLHFIRKELQQEHYVVEIAESSAEGLARLQDEAYDCVLVDFEMPGQDGAEVCASIRQIRGDANPEVVLIMLTSHDDKEFMTRSFAAGADDYITKSSDFSVIRARIRALVRRKFLVDENRRVLEEIRLREIAVVRERAEREAAEMRAKLADQLAVANRRLDLANQELEHFAFSAAHDLREPLRMVSVYSELLRMHYQGKLDEQADQFIGFCVQGARRMDRLIQNLLDYARASNDSFSATELTDLNKVVDEAAAMLQSVMQEAGAEITKDPLPKLNVEAIRIQQLFQNLIGNAIKYRRPEAPPRIHIGANLIGDEWVFSISDNGMGIESDHWDRVFNIFERLDRGNSGSGLGLSICKRIVEGLGGRIWVTSEPGAGSNFQFALPATLAAPRAETTTV